MYNHQFAGDFQKVCITKNAKGNQVHNIFKKKKKEQQINYKCEESICRKENSTIEAIFYHTKNVVVDIT